MFVHGKHFQTSLLFVGKVRSLPYSGAPESLFNRAGSCFANRQLTRLKSLAMDKHSSLLRTFVNYGRKKFYNIWAQSAAFVGDKDHLRSVVRQHPAEVNTKDKVRVKHSGQKQTGRTKNMN